MNLRLVVWEDAFIGPYCKIGGEIEASIIQGFSNKQHDGFLGHSYVDAWVNIDAASVSSDLKNTYGSVRVPINGIGVDSSETFVVLLISDHSKIGINVVFPTCKRQRPLGIPEFLHKPPDRVFALQANFNQPP